MPKAPKALLKHTFTVCIRKSKQRKHFEQNHVIGIPVSSLKGGQGMEFTSSFSDIRLMIGRRGHRGNDEENILSVQNYEGSREVR